MGRLTELDLKKKVESKKEYHGQLGQLQLKFLLYQRVILEQKRSVICLFEGPDAAGKGGVIRRITEKLDPRSLRVYSIIKPTHEEYQHHYLWRFWNKLPTYGQIAIFDRSWYGRVLVERVEGFATKSEWMRGFGEINEFERVLYDDGVILMKFYLHISKKEQLLRFKKRAEDPYKRWKINDEDWRNRRKWDQYVIAAEEMFERTGTQHAPWHLIEAEHKWHARLRVLGLIVKRLEKEIGKV